MTAPGITGRQVHYVKEHDLILQCNYWEKHLVKNVVSGNWSADDLQSLLKAVSCYAWRDSCCKLQHSRGWHEQKGHHHSSPAMKALSCGKDFMEKAVFITLSINNNKFQKWCKRHPPSTTSQRGFLYIAAGMLKAQKVGHCIAQVIFPTLPV